MRIHHVGYLVKKMDKAVKQFEFLGYETVQDTVYDASRDADICFMLKDTYRVELVCPKSPSSVVYGLLKTMRNSPYHICYETDNFDEDVRRAEQNGFTIMNEVSPAPALENRRVCFLYGSGTGITELLEKA